jgi:hypothetical protein
MQAKTKLLIALLIAASLVTAITALADDVYFPLMPNDPTNTPTLTPTVTQTPAITPTPTRTPVPTDVYISDLEPNLDDDDPLDEWIEITNNSSDDIDMENWLIRSESSGLVYNFPDNFTLDEDDSVRVWSGSGSNSSSNLYWGLTEDEVDNEGAWDDDHDSAYLRYRDEDENTLIDEYEY